MSQFVNSMARLQESYGQSSGFLLGVGILLAAALIAYFAGCFNGSVIVSKYLLHNDVRNHGSGNAGLTNFHRVFGGPLTLAVLLTDVLKAIVAVLVGGALVGLVFGGGDAELLIVGKYMSGMFCVLGHMFPCFFHFRGGKGILSGGTIAILVDWRVAVIVWGCFLLLVILTRWVSLGSCVAGALFPVATGLVFRDILCTVFALICGILIIWKHRGNIQRLLRGEEPKFSLHRKKEIES